MPDGVGVAEALPRHQEWEARARMKMATGEEVRSTGFGPTEADAFEAAIKNLVEKLP